MKKLSKGHLGDAQWGCLHIPVPALKSGSFPFDSALHFLSRNNSKALQRDSNSFLVGQEARKQVWRRCWRKRGSPGEGGVCVLVVGSHSTACPAFQVPFTPSGWSESQLLYRLEDFSHCHSHAPALPCPHAPGSVVHAEQHHCSFGAGGPQLLVLFSVKSQETRFVTPSHLWEKPLGDSLSAFLSP